jgi:hypothetical protein
MASHGIKQRSTAHASSRHAPERQGFVCVELHPNMADSCRGVSDSQSDVSNGA